jgi:hypothetical protein
MVLQVIAGLRILYAVPAVIDFVRLQRLRDLRTVLRIFLTSYTRREEAELIPLVFGKFSAHFAGVVVAIDINLAALFPTASTDFRIAPIVIGSAAVSAPAGMADVGAIKRVNDDGDVA